MLERLHRDGHQCLIFSQMTKVLNVMEDYLRFRGWQYCRIDGSTNIDERQRQMDVFNAEKTSGLDGARNEADDRNFVFLLSTRAGGLGINLTAADTCILFDSDFNPFNDSQAMGTIHMVARVAGLIHAFAMCLMLTIAFEPNNHRSLSPTRSDAPGCRVPAPHGELGRH
jgi:SNF2 family DNA or RNA helicase